jgi:PST family polysaccharide transporter
MALTLIFLKYLLLEAFEVQFLKNLFDTSEKKRLVENFFFLSILQVFNFILPLLTFPYLVRVLGVEKFGLFAFAMSFISYFTIISDYGFNLTATKAVSINRNKKTKLNEISSAILTIKFILVIFCFLLLLLFVYNIDRFYDDRLIFILTFGNVVGQALFPTWFFLGIEQMKHITVINAVTKLIFAGSIFIFVKNTNDFFLVPILFSLGSILGGAYGFWLLINRYCINFSFQTKETLRDYFQEGWQIFASSFAINIYINSNTLILGLITNDVLVGFYSIAEKIMKALRSLVSMAFQVIYPYICNLAKNRAHLQVFFRKFLVLGGAPLFITGLALSYLSPEIVHFFVSDKESIAVYVLRVLSMVPFIVFLNIPAYQSLLIFDSKQIYAKILITGSLLNIILNSCLASFYGPIGTAYSVLMTEIFITCSLYLAWYSCKTKLKTE